MSRVKRLLTPLVFLLVLPVAVLLVVVHYLLNAPFSYFDED